MLSPDLRTRRRFVPLLAAGLVVFIGVVLLGGLTGLVWYIYTFDLWVKLNPSILGFAADWSLWGICFLLTVSPFGVAVLRGRASTDPTVLFVFVIAPLLSLVATSLSYYVGATLFVSSGFLVAYTLVSRSPIFLGIKKGSALRIVCVEVFGLLALISAGGAVSVLLWRENFLFALTSGSNIAPADSWLSVLAIDLEVFFLARPILVAILIALAFAAILALLKEPLGSAMKRFHEFRADEAQKTESQTLSPLAHKYGKRAALQKSLPYLIIVVSVVLGFAIAIYPYLIEGYRGVLGVDSQFYVDNLQSMRSLRDALPLAWLGRSLFFVVLFLVKVLTGLSSDWVVRLMPAVLTALLALSTFLLVKEGTDRSWVAAFAALLSVFSAQTALGMSAGIITNWFALSIANFMFALIVRAVRLQSKVAAVGALLVSLFLLGAYSFQWVVAMVELALVLTASLLTFRKADHNEWKYEVVAAGGVLFGSILIPIALLVALVPLLGFHAQDIDPSQWFSLAWVFVAQMQPQLLGTIWGALEEALNFAGNRIDLPILTFLSIIGLLDSSAQSRSFNRMLAAMTVVPVLLTIVISISSASPYTPMWLTWRGLYIIPLYMTGALGAESIIRRVNGSASSWSSLSRLAFAGSFSAYLLLSHVSYSLRALELLILVARMS